MNIEKVTFISPDLPYPTLVTHALFAEFGMPLIATIVRDAGYDVKAFVEHIGPVKWDQVMESDVVCFHTFSASMPTTVEYIKKIRAARPDMPIILGGTHASVMAEDTLQYCDVVIRQEGDETLPEVLAKWREDKDLSDVLGVTYWDNGHVRHNPDRPYTHDIDTITDLELIDGYMGWSKPKLLWKQRMRFQLLQTSRGCPFACTFCIAPRELGQGYRMRNVDSVIADIKYQKDLVGTRYFFIVDNHFTVNRAHSKVLLQRIIDEKINWAAVCFTRLEVSRDDEMLRLLKQAKIGTLYIGLESFDDNVLKLLNKQQDRESIEKAVKKIKSFGLNVLGSFVLGSDSDTVESIRKTIDTAIEQDVDYLALFPLSGYPEYNAPTIPLNRFFMPTWDKLDGNFVIFLPKNMKPSTLQREVSASYKRFFSPKQILRKLVQRKFYGALKRLGYAIQVWEIRKATNKWADYLETIEGQYYDENEQLIESMLGEEGVHPAQFPGSSMGAGLENAVIGGD